MVRSAVASPKNVQTIVRNVEAAMAAAKDGVVREGRRLGPGGTGECLRTNFALLCDMVQQQDGHLLTDEEHSLLRAFQVFLLPLSPPSFHHTVALNHLRLTASQWLSRLCQQLKPCDVSPPRAC